MFYRQESFLNQESVECKEIINFFTCKTTSPEKFDSIIDIVRSKKIYGPKELKRIESGRLSRLDYSTYKSVKVNLILGVVNKLVEFGFLIQFGNDSDGNPTFVQNKEAIAIAERNGIIDNILGIDYVLDKYSHSVVPIVVEQDGIEEIGTGFIVENCSRKFVITNAHVIDGFAKRKIISASNTNFIEKNFQIFKDVDLAIIEIDFDYPLNCFYLNLDPKLLESIITIGYPKVPMTKDNYKYFHKGEINSFVKNYYNFDLIIYSAKTSAGNSGSPLINEQGEVLGIVTNELFNKAQFEKSGTLPYYAAIPSSIILSKLNEVIKNFH